MRNGLVFLQSLPEWHDSYLHEITIFPGGERDDQVELDRAGPQLDQDGRKPQPGLLVHYERLLRDQA